MVPSPLHDRYEVLRPLARGGMAMVHLAREVDTGREIALKQLVVPEGARVAEWRLRFQQEFHTAARLRHPNVVATYDYADARSGGLPFFTMEYLPGPGLEETIPMDPKRALALLPGLLQGLAYMHHQGLVHGDLKPENVRMGADGQLRLVDLGLVTRVGQPSPGVQGTLPYLAPEVIRRAPTDRRSDLYALGAVMFHLLANRPPFHGDNREVLFGHLESPPPRLADLVPGIPPELDEIVMKLLAKDPLARFQSADEVLAYLAGGSGEVEDDQTLFHPPLIGRVKELRELAAALNRAKGGAYEEVWLQGDGDAGLAALLEEFCCRSQLLGASVLRGTMRARMAPLEGLRAIARGLVALARPHALDLAPLMHLLARVAPELGQASTPDAADPQQERLRVFDALTHALRLAALSGPLVLAFADAHQAEPAWREWLDHVRRNAPELPVLMLCTHVGEADVDFDPCRTTLDLPPMEEAHTREMCAAILGQAELSLDFVARVQAATSGWPARVDALLRTLAGGGWLRRREGKWTLPDGDLAVLAASVAPAAAVEQGNTLADALLDVLLVLGREVDLLQLWQMACRLAQPGAPALADDAAPDPAQSSELFEALRGLEEHRHVRGLDGVYALAPELDRAGRLAALGGDRRQAVHGAIAAVLEAQLARAPEDLALLTELATHALGAFDAERGPKHALAAAVQQARLFALEAAEDLLAESLALMERGDAPDGALLLAHMRLRAEVGRLAGDRRRAEATYPQALALAGELGDVESLAALSNGYGRFKLATGEPVEASRRFEEALALLDGRGTHAEAALALTMLGRCALGQGDLPQASSWVERALALARQGGYRSLVRENMAQLGYLYVASDDDRATEGLGLLFEAIQLIEKDEAKLELNACYALLGNAQLLMGRFVEARMAFQRNCDLCAEIGAAPHDEATAFMRRAQVALEVGDYRGARQSTAPAGALARMVGDKLLLAQVRLIEGMAALYQGDFMIYQDAMALVEDTIQASTAPALEAMALTCRAEAEAYLGQTSAALSSAGAALTLMENAMGHEYRERAQLIKAEALIRLGLSKPALALLDELGRPRNDATHARVLLARAHHERLANKTLMALHQGEKALDLARRAGVVPVAAACCMLLARVTPDADAALGWSRKALLDAEVCGQPALEAEALFQASRVAAHVAQADWFLGAAGEAWRRATGGLSPAHVEAFGRTDERKEMRDALARRASEGYRLSRADHEKLLDILSRPPAPADLFRAICEICHDVTRAERVALFWEDASGMPTAVAAEGPAYGGATVPAEELERAREASAGVLLLPLDAGPHPGEAPQPWGALLVTGVMADHAERLERLLAKLGGALWAARVIWLAERAQQVPSDLSASK
nr:serine/threonine protein kinase [uncultured bacterium]